MPRGQKKDGGNGKDQAQKQPMNVILLKKEVDLEWVFYYWLSAYTHTSIAFLTKQISILKLIENVTWILSKF